MMNDFIIYRHAWRYSLAPDKEPQLSDSQCKALLKKGAWLVRNTYDFDCREETNFWYVIKDSFGGMDELSRKDRKSVRIALNSIEYRIIDKKLIENQGYEIAKKLYESYGNRYAKMDKIDFQYLLNSWTENDYDFWGIFDKKDNFFVGFSVVRLFNECCLYDIACILPEYKRNKTNVYYGMYYKHNEYYLGEKNYKYVSDGSRSITDHSNVQPFLIHKFKFRKAYCKLKIHYKWWFGAIVRVLYPFRGLIWSRNVKAVLRMHGMQS